MRILLREQLKNERFWIVSISNNKAVVIDGETANKFLIDCGSTMGLIKFCSMTENALYQFIREAGGYDLPSIET